MTRIKLGHNRFATVDESDTDLLAMYSWRIDGRGYAVTQVQNDGVRKTILMHRLILKAPKGLQVDHINHDKLDNRRLNLRLCTSSQNHMNRKNLPSGTYWDGSRGRWASQIKMNNKRRFLGRFDRRQDAIDAYMHARKILFGDFS